MLVYLYILWLYATNVILPYYSLYLKSIVTPIDGL